VAERLVELMATLVEAAERHLDWPMPGYTHLQRAQPVYVSHHLLAYFWMFRRDHERVVFCHRAAQELPLGAGALAGVSWNTSRSQLARELGFARVSRNSLDAVSNRDFVLDFLSAAAIAAMHLSRLGAEIVLWTSEEFGFLELPDSFSSGSSIMPQKKNPDAAELLRAKAPRLASDFSALLGVLHGLPLAYNKDLQDDKHYLFDAADTLELGLEAAAGMLRGASFDRERLAAAASDEFLAATEIADLLAKKGVPFREAHGIVAETVRYALDQGKALSELSRDELARFSNELDDDYYEVLSSRSWLESKVSEGGTASARVREQLSEARNALEGMRGDAEA
jgi:argininosuccinate lyase